METLFLFCSLRREESYRAHVPSYPDMPQEGIAQPLALTSPLNKPSNVSHIEEGRNLASWLVMIHKPVKPGVRNRNPGGKLDDDISSKK